MYCKTGRQEEFRPRGLPSCQTVPSCHHPVCLTGLVSLHFPVGLSVGRSRGDKGRKGGREEGERGESAIFLPPLHRRAVAIALSFLTWKEEEWPANTTYLSLTPIKASPSRGKCIGGEKGK